MPNGRLKTILKTWHRTFSVLALAATALSIFAWLCLRDPAINFLSGKHPANWIIFPTVAEATLYRFASCDTIFRRDFVLNELPRTAQLSIRGMRRADLKINRTHVELGATGNWKDVSIVAVRDLLRPGRNEIEARVFNHTGPPALWLVLTVGETTLSSDQNWEASINGSAWRRAALASATKISGPGNPIAGGEETLAALAKVWPLWLGFFGVAAALCAVVAHLWATGRVGVKHISATLPTGKRLQIIAPFVLGIFWLILFWNNIQLLPYHAGFDSEHHLAYIKYIQEHRALPLPTQGWEMYQPPLYYIISAVALSACGLSINNPASVLVLRLFGTVFGIAQFTLVFLSLRVLFPNRIGLQLVGLMLAAFLPMHLYLSHYATNEMLAAALVTAAIYLALRLLRSQSPSMSQPAWLGLTAGAAMLTKVTGILLLPVLLAAMIGKFASERAAIGTWLRCLGTLLAICLAVCGWHYARVWIKFGTPLLGNWDVASGFAWWQEPGYRTATDYFRFGRALIWPLFSGFAGIADGIYSTLWGDGLCGGIAGLASRPPWNYQIMVAGYLLALVPTVVILTGAAIGFVRLIRKPTADLFLLLGILAAVALGLIFMTLKVASYAQTKAFYALSILLPICYCAALGWEALTRGRRPLKFALAALLLVWAMNSFASVWITRSVPQRLYSAQAARGEGKIDIAESQVAKAVEWEPTNANARWFHALVLDDLDRHEEARKEAERAVELSPADSAARLQLAMSIKRDDTERAIAEAHHAIELGPENSAAYQLLMGLLTKTHRNDEAIDLARDWLTISPFNPDIHYPFALALADRGDLATAAKHFGYMMMLRPDLEKAHARLRGALLAWAKREDGAMQLHAIAEQAPDSPRMLDELAWLFATHPDSQVHDGQEAVHLAERACMLTDRQIPALLDTLAAAYAEAGKFSIAVKTAEEALTRARSIGDSEAERLSENILASIRENVPYREEPIRE